MVYSLESTSLPLRASGFSFSRTIWEIVSFFLSVVINGGFNKNLGKSLSLHDRDASNFLLKNHLRSSEFIIAAKFLTKRALNMEAVGSTFRQLWRSTRVSKFAILITTLSYLFSETRMMLIVYFKVNHGALIST